MRATNFSSRWTPPPPPTHTPFLVEEASSAQMQHVFISYTTRVLVFSIKCFLKMMSLSFFLPLMDFYPQTFVCVFLPLMDFYHKRLCVSSCHLWTFITNVCMCLLATCGLLSQTFVCVSSCHLWTFITSVCVCLLATCGLLTFCLFPAACLLTSSFGS